ncbi:DNA-binding response regulator [bacterium D16-51]|nr:DNA-binding response regulator [bacterium D16-59]RKI57636.1 DNA-binding response regulator [bacterium D16-51]
MFSVAICDDEPYFREQMKEMLLQYMQDSGIYYKIDLFQSGTELIKLGIELNQYNIIFLDINMDEMDGILTAKKIREQNSEIFLVFVTAFVNYSLEGYKVDAVRYLLKNNVNMQESIAECMDAIYKKINYEVIWKEFVFNEGKKRISLDCLLYIESRLHKLELHVMEDRMITYTIYDTLNNMENYIGSKKFIRLHQSFLVNMKYIKSVSQYEAVLHSGKSFPIPKARYKKVWDTYLAYRGEM